MGAISQLNINEEKTRGHQPRALGPWTQFDVVLIDPFLTDHRSRLASEYRYNS